MKKILVLILTLCILFTLTACGKKEQVQSAPTMAVNGVPAGEQAMVEETESVLLLNSQRVYPFPAGCSVRHLARIQNHLFITGYQEGTPVLGITDYLLNADGSATFGETKMLDLDMSSPYHESLKGVAAAGDGCFYLLTGEHSPVYMYKDELRTNNDYQGRLAVLKFSQTGEMLDRMEINNWHGEISFGLAVDTAGRIYVLGEDEVSSFNWGSDEVTTIKKKDSTMYSIELTSQGVVVSLWEQTGNRYYLIESPEHLRELAFENPGENLSVSVGNMAMCQGLDGEYIISANSYFVECDVESCNTREIYKWDYTAFPNGAESVCRLGKNAFLCTVGEDFMLSTAMVPRPKTDTSVVNIAAFDMDNSNVGGIVNELNNRQTQYEYRVIVYGKDEIQRLITDIISGGKIDLVIHNNLLDVKSDAFLNLYPYIDKDFGRDSFIPNILETLSDNGQLHELWEGVEIRTLAARTADVEGRENLTPWDYQQIAADSGQYDAVFQTFMDKENLLRWVAQVGLVKFVDRQNGTCSFDDAGFVDLLGWCNDMCDTMPEGRDMVSLDISQVVLTMEMISDPVRIKFIGNNFGQPFSFVGFPTGGQGLSYYTCTYNGSMAIPSNSQNIDGAWAYIKNRLSMESQTSIDYLPVMLQAFTRQAAGVLNQEESQQLLDLVASTTSALRCTDQQILDIIMENGRKYLAGDKSLDETVKNIESQANLYMSEQYG